MGQHSQAGEAGGQVLVTLVDEAWHEAPGLRGALLALCRSIDGRDGCALHVSIELGGMMVFAGNEVGLAALLKEAPETPGREPMRLVNHGPFNTPLMKASSEGAMKSLPAHWFGSPTAPMSTPPRDRSRARRSRSSGIPRGERGAGFHSDGGHRRRRAEPLLRQAPAPGSEPACRCVPARDLPAFREACLARPPGRSSAADPRACLGSGSGRPAGRCRWSVRNAGSIPPTPWSSRPSTMPSPISAASPNGGDVMPTGPSRQCGKRRA